MKPIHSTLASALPLLVLSGNAFGIDAPADNAPPPPAAIEQAQQPIEKKDDTAFLGVISQPVPEILREHLGLEENEGVMIQTVIPDGPAAKAGIAANDVITSIDGKAITSPQDLSAAIAKHKSGEKIDAAIVHHGKPKQLNIELGERPEHIPMIGGGPNLLQDGDALGDLGLPDDFADRIQRMLEEGGAGFELPPLDGGAEMRIPDLRQLRLQMRQALGDELEIQPENQNHRFQAFQGATIRMKDGDGSVEIKDVNGSKEVTVTDNDGQTIWSGPWDTDQDKAAAPENVRERIDRLNIDHMKGGLNLRFDSK